MFSDLNVFLGDLPVPIGHGSFRGQRQLDTIDHFRAPRPISSMGKSGKQGMVVFINANFFKILIALNIYVSF